MCKALISKKGGSSKKGLSHADWVISMGIFIVAIISLFIFLRPGAQPVYQSDTLLSIVERGLKEEVVWEIKEVPLFIEKCKPYTPSGEKELKPAVIKIKEESGFWDYFIYNDKGDKINDEVKCIGDLIIEDDTYLVRLHSDSKESEEPELSLELTPDDKIHLIAKLGASETIEGINEKWLDELKKAEYEDLKKKWVYPDSRDFGIYINNNFFLGKEPSNQVSVFVKEWKTWILDEDGSKEEILISMRVY